MSRNLTVQRLLLRREVAGEVAAATVVVAVLQQLIPMPIDQRLKVMAIFSSRQIATTFSATMVVPGIPGGRSQN